MKANITTRLLLLVSTVAFSGALLTIKPDSPQDQDFARLRLDVKADKDKYVLGELVNLKFNITNTSDEPVSVDKNSDVYTGALRVFVAYESGDFKKYLGPRWSVKDAGVSFIKLSPGKSYQTEATMLCNPVIDTAHLNPSAAAQAIKDENFVDGLYTLSQPGSYYIKAVLYDTDSVHKIESEPVRIIEEEPLGDDIQFWETIKNDRNYGYFIQTGHLNESNNGSKTMRIVGKLEQLLSSNPNSRYAAMITHGLSKHRSLMEKLNKVSSR